MSDMFCFIRKRKKHGNKKGKKVLRFDDRMLYGFCLREKKVKTNSTGTKGTGTQT